MTQQMSLEAYRTVLQELREDLLQVLTDLPRLDGYIFRRPMANDDHWVFPPFGIASSSAPC